MEVALNVKIYYCPQLLLVVQSYAENSMSGFVIFLLLQLYLVQGFLGTCALTPVL